MAGPQPQRRPLRAKHRARAVKAAPRVRAGRVGPLAPAVAAVVLTGCASFSPDAGMGVVSAIALTELNKDARKIDHEEAAAAARARVQRLLATGLSPDPAGQIA